MEFESLRDYVVGDDPRRVDWAASARRGRPVTRLYQHERRHTVLVALRDRAYEALAPTAPLGADGPLDLYRRIVLDELLREREAALGRLRRGGLETVDLLPEAITAEVLNRYLAIRHGPER